MLNLLFVAIGVLLLTGGGEALIRGSLAAANRLGIDTALSERPDIAVGNLVGSKNVTDSFILSLHWEAA